MIHYDHGGIKEYQNIETFKYFFIITIIINFQTALLIYIFITLAVTS